MKFRARLAARGQSPVARDSSDDRRLPADGLPARHARLPHHDIVGWKFSGLAGAALPTFGMSWLGVRRDKTAFFSGCKSHPATAPAGSNRSS